MGIVRVRLASGSRLKPLNARQGGGGWFLRVGLGSEQMSVIVWVGWLWHLAAGRKPLKGKPQVRVREMGSCG